MSDGVLLFARLMPCVRPSHPQTSRFVPPPGPVSDYPARPPAVYRDSPLFCRRHLPLRHRRARVGLVLLGRKSLLHRVGNFSLKPRFFSGILVDQASRGSATVEKSLLFADFQGFLQRRVSSRLGAQPIVQSASQDQAASPDRRRRPWGFAAFKVSIAQRRRASPG